ncbi:MAG: DUF86 domain-containing protein [Crocinitomicaceae bacterium]|nr:DUF86 domain-containing protein [Crocinitomicaceae bacterium]
MRRILEYTDGISYHEFTSNSLVRDAVIRNFEIMGESVKHIPFGFQKKFRHIPWQRMFDLRNFIVNEYFDVDDEILWEIINVDLARNTADLERVLNDRDISFNRKRNVRE